MREYCQPLISTQRPVTFVRQKEAFGGCQVIDNIFSLGSAYREADYQD
jgi:hypothetical protein